MRDIELLNALTVLARRLGLLDDAERLVIETRGIAAHPRCLVPSPPGYLKNGLVLLCSRPEGHLSDGHSWSTAFLGIVAPAAERCPAAYGHGGHTRCHLDAGHEGHHGGTGPVGPLEWDDTGALYPPNVTADPVVIVDWGTVTLTTDSPLIRCEVKQGDVQCVKLRGHEDLHMRPDGTVMIWRKDEPGKRPEFDPRPSTPIEICDTPLPGGVVCGGPNDAVHHCLDDQGKPNYPTDPRA